MNNAKIIEDYSSGEENNDALPILRQRATELTELIEALRNLIKSNYWIVLQKEIDNDLISLKSRLESEKDTVEIFKLQGAISQAKKYDLQKKLDLKLKELELIKAKI